MFVYQMRDKKEISTNCVCDLSNFYVVDLYVIGQKWREQDYDVCIMNFDIVIFTNHKLCATKILEL